MIFTLDLVVTYLISKRGPQNSLLKIIYQNSLLKIIYRNSLLKIIYQNSLLKIIYQNSLLKLSIDKNYLSSELRSQIVHRSRSFRSVAHHYIIYIYLIFFIF